MPQIKAVIKSRTLELISFGAGLFVGLGWSFASPRQVGGLEVLVTALPMSAIAISSYYSSNGNMRAAVGRLGLPMYAGEVVGQLISEAVKRNYFY